MPQSATQDLSIIAVVIWYEPQEYFVENIRSYMSNVDHVIVVDNSVSDNAAMLAKLPNVLYAPLRHNAGIAAALNHGVAEAAALGADWVLTMDQDSRFEVNEIEALTAAAQSLQHDTEVAVIGAITDPKMEKTFECKEVPRLITSGSLNRLSSLKAVEGFDEKLFIDCVDFDFCYRLRRAGYKIIMDKSSKLDHRRGAPTFVTWRGQTYTSYNYSPDRYYYQVRNILYLGRRFPEYYESSSRRDIRKILRNVLLFEANKLHNLTAVVQGMLHFLFGRYGSRDRTFPLPFRKHE